MTVQRIIHNNLKLFPCKVQILQKQTDANKEERSEFRQTISERIENNPGDLGLIPFSEEAHSYLSGRVSKQNMRFWASQQPHKHTQWPLSQEKLRVWCAMGKGGIFGPYFFEDDADCVAVNAEWYIKVMQRKIIPALRRKRGIDMNTVVFQQDGAPPHCSNRTLEYLRQYFPGDKLISHRIDNPWPPYFPDLTPPQLVSVGVPERQSL